MKPISLDKICAGTELDTALAGKIITTVTTDSRQAAPGTLFVALKGQRLDGHDFVPQAFEKGAEAALVCGDRVEAIRKAVAPVYGNKLIAVPDTLEALGRLAANFRKELSVPVIGITGSVGKTSTKDFTACAFSLLGNVARTKLNYNNEIGLPLTVLSVETTDRALIGEMGMRGLGEIKYLAKILKPNIGIITNIGVSHIERLGSRENIMLAKTEICYGMAPGSTLLVSCGDRVITKEKILDRVKSFNKDIHVKFFGFDSHCDYWADSIETGSDGNVSFRFHPGSFQVSLSVAGVHNVSNALSALAAADIYGIPLEKAIPYVEGFCGDRVRQNIIHKNGITIIDDTYNAGPESMQAALAVLGTLPRIQRKIAVLGSMLELGAASDEAHKVVCQAAEKNGVDILITVGDTWGQSLPQCGVQHKISCASWQEAISAIKRLCGDRVGMNGDSHGKMYTVGDGFLIKGSHAMHMDNIVKALTEGEKH